MTAKRSAAGRGLGSAGAPGQAGEQDFFVERGDVRIAVTDLGGAGRTLILLHGLAGSARELLPTGRALRDSFRVVLIDQRGHGRSTRRPEDLSREAFVDDLVDVIETVSHDRPVVLVGQSMGAHTAFLAAAARPDLVDRLVLLEGHAAGGEPASAAAELGAFFSTWPAPFADTAAARAFLGESRLADAWIADLETTAEGVRPRFDPDIMERTIRAVHVPRWDEWQGLEVPVLAVFAEHGMFSSEQRDELRRRRPQTECAVLRGGTHDAHLDAFEEWVAALRAYLLR